MYKTLLLFLLLSATAFSQETIVLRGEVLNDSIEKASLTVVNISLRKGAITNEAGIFEIPVRVSDTINISAVQYDSKQFVVTQKMYDRKTMSLYLVPKINELDEVKISNMDLTGYLRRDILNTPLEKTITAASLGLPVNAHPPFTPEERRVYSASGKGAGAFGSLIMAINGQAKSYKKQLEVMRFQMKVEKAREKFSDTLYMKSLNIPENLIEDFVFFVFEEKKIEGKDDAENVMDLLEYMLTKSKKYVALKQKERALLKNKKDE
ncbi:hypothetical protein [uncultured Dokdonia sp.]|uniref:hypothetical protein n=1 Tax=uncultured Dokdonia sp. TaxID=575653 RepID=UPI0026337C06|nr:hypothetical protein [uncultured Dokdonia sp.]